MTGSQRARWLKLLREYHEDWLGEPCTWTEQQLLDLTTSEIAAMFWLEVKRRSVQHNTVMS